MYLLNMPNNEREKKSNQFDLKRIVVQFVGLGRVGRDTRAVICKLSAR